MKEIEKPSISALLAPEGGEALIMFYGTNCNKCHFRMPILEKFGEETGIDIPLYKFDAEKNFDKELMDKYNVSAIPVVVWIKDGLEIARCETPVPNNDLAAVLGINLVWRQGTLIDS